MLGFASGLWRQTAWVRAKFTNIYPRVTSGLHTELARGEPPSSPGAHRLVSKLPAKVTGCPVPLGPGRMRAPLRKVPLEVMPTTARGWAPDALAEPALGTAACEEAVRHSCMCLGLDTTLFLWEVALRDSLTWGSLLPLLCSSGPLPGSPLGLPGRACPKDSSHWLHNCWGTGAGRTSGGRGRLRLPGVTAPERWPDAT